VANFAIGHQPETPSAGEPMYQSYCANGRGGGKNFMPHVGAPTKKGHTDLLDDDYLGAIITERGPAFASIVRALLVAVCKTCIASNQTQGGDYP
jgi:hypothetical protein